MKAAWHHLRLNELINPHFSPVLLVVAALRQTESDPVVLASVAPTIMAAGELEVVGSHFKNADRALPPQHQTSSVTITTSPRVSVKKK